MNLGKIDLTSLAPSEQPFEDDQSAILRSTVSEAIKINPDNAAKNIRLSKESGIPAMSIPGGEADVEQMVNLKKIDLKSMQKNNPKTSALMSDFNNATITHDDVEGLTRLEDVLTMATDVARSPSAGAMKGIGMGLEGVTETYDVLTRNTRRLIDAMTPAGFEDYTGRDFKFDPAKPIRWEGEKLQQLGDTLGVPRDRANYATDVAEAVGQMGSQIAMVMMNPALGMTMLFGQGVQQQAERQKQTDTLGQDVTSDVGLVVGGIATYASEKIALDKILNRLPPTIKNGIARNITDIAIAGGIEAAQEVAENAAHDLIEMATTNPDAELFKGAGYEALVAGGAGAVARAMLLSFLPGKVGTFKDFGDTVQTQTDVEQKQIDDIVDATEKVKLKGRESDTFKQFVESINEEKVHLDAEKVIEYMKTLDANTLQNDPVMKLLTENAPESAVTGGDITIDMKDFTNTFVGSEHFEALRPHMRLSAMSDTPFRKDETRKEAESYIQKLTEEAQKNVSEYVEAQDIYTQVRDQLIDTGRMTPQQASVSAQIVPAWATVQAKKRGISVAQVYQESGLTIEGPMTGKRAEIEGEGVTFAQKIIDKAQNVISKIKGEFDFKGQSKVKTEDVFANKQATPPMQLRKDAEKLIEDEKFMEIPQTSVPISSIVPTQKFLGETNLNKVKEVSGDTNAFLVRSGDKYYVLDGHHRIAASMLNGNESIKAHVFEESGTLKQETSKKKTRGYYDPANSLIRLTESSDLSTFFHEFAHFMYDMEKQSGGDMVQPIHDWFKSNAEDVAKEATGYHDAKDISSVDVVAYLDIGATGDKTIDMAIERAVHEQFARGFETYLMEGKAPSMELRNVFRTISRWLSDIYNKIRGQLSVNLDNEMRQVFDRLLATEEQIQAAEARARIEPMFTDATMAGMTEEEFQKYNERVQTASNEAAETLRDKLIKEYTRKTEKWWKIEKSDIVDEELQMLKNEPVYRARDVLKNGQMKLDRAALKAMTSEERVDKRGRKSVRIPAEFNGMHVPGGEGINPDEAAAFFGYNSGDEMIKDIMTSLDINEVADQNAEAKMVEKYGDILNDGTIAEEADIAVQNESRGVMILEELKALNKGTNRATLDRQTMKSLAEDNIGKLSFRNINPAKYRRAEIKAAQEAAAALERNDKTAAASAKSRQALNFYLGKAATDARNETLSIVDFMARYRKKSVRENIMSAGNEYWEQLEKILSRFEFRKGVSLKYVDQTNQSLQTWMNERINNDGDGLVLSPEVLNESIVTHWKNIPFSELMGVRDSIKNIEHVARYSNKVKIGEEKVDFNKLVQNWTEHMDAVQPSRFKSQRTDVTEGRNWGRWAMAQMTKIPYLASWLDGQERAGMSHDILVQPFTDAYDAELKLWKDIGTPLMELIQNRSKEDMKRHNTKIFIPEIKDAKNDGNLYGHQIIAVALNTGNKGNLKKMLLGEGWANPDVEEEISLENAKLKAVLAHMTESDWKMVQEIWDQMDKLYPQLAEVHRRTTGIVPPKVEASPVVTPYGTFKGGYYPVKYDPRRSFRAELQEDKLNAQTESMFGTVGIQASVNASATNERTGYYAPIRLSLDVVPNHFQETIHYITHHDAVRQTNKLIRNATVAETIKAKLGEEEFAQLKPWLNDIAKDGREAPTKVWWESILQRLRFGSTLGIMGFSASTGIVQILGLSNTMAEVGVGNTLQAIRSILGSPSTMADSWQFAVDNSKVMNHRMQTMDREIRNAMKRIEGKHGFLAGAQEVSMKHIALLQTYMVDLPTWHAAYIKGMKDFGGDEARAYRYADWAVENIQGSGVTKDLAQVMRSQNEANRMMTMFMTFFSALWNMERDTVKGARAKTYSRTTIAAKAIFLFMIPVFAEMVLKGQFGGDDDDDETALQKYLTNLALYPVSSVPFLRDIASGVIGDYGYNISPIAQLLESGTQSIPELLVRPFTDEEITKGQIKGTTKLVGAALGIPGVSQVWRTGEHLEKVMVEGEDLTIKELLYGPEK